MVSHTPISSSSIPADKTMWAELIAKPTSILGQTGQENIVYYLSDDLVSDQAGVARNPFGFLRQYVEVIISRNYNPEETEAGYHGQVRKLL